VDEKTWNQTAGGGKIGNPKKTEREDGQCSARFVLSFRKGFETRNERQTSKNRSDSKPQKSRLFSALRGLKNGVHLSVFFLLKNLARVRSNLAEWTGKSFEQPKGCSARLSFALGLSSHNAGKAYSTSNKGFSRVSRQAKTSCGGQNV
jgi:hypothetical protein